MNLPEIKRFNIRVYGLALNERLEVLLSDEFMMGRKMTKFPGGGLYFGEGPADCLRREALEEFGQEVEILEHFYTTHFFQRSFFYEDSQLICIYYRIRFIQPLAFRISDRPFDFPEGAEGMQSFRYVPLSRLQESELTFPVDRYVLELLKHQSGNKRLHQAFQGNLPA